MSGLLLWCVVALLGGAGSVARFLLDGAVSERSSSAFPAGTLAVNLAGSMLLGLAAGVALRGDALLLAGTALVGSFTTFSTWMFETHRLAEDGRTRLLALNVAGSLALGVAGAALGRALGSAL